MHFIKQDFINKKKHLTTHMCKTSDERKTSFQLDVISKVGTRRDSSQIELKKRRKQNKTNWSLSDDRDGSAIRGGHESI